MSLSLSALSQRGSGRTTSGQIGILSHQVLVPSRTRFWYFQGDQSQLLLESHTTAARSQRLPILEGLGTVHRSDGVFQRGCQMYRDTGLTNEIRAVILIRIDRALPVNSPAYDRGETEEQVNDRWRRYWCKLWGIS